MRILVPLFLLLSLSSVYAQETVNSLDLASPAFTVQERALLVATEGVYFSKSIFEEKTVSTFFKKNGAGGSTAIRYNYAYTFYIGPTAVSWEIFFDRIGLSDFTAEHNKVARIRRSRHTPGLLGILLGIGVGYIGLVGTVWGEEGEGVATALAGAGIGVGSLILALTDPSFPSAPSEEYFIAVSNEENRKKLQPRRLE